MHSAACLAAAICLAAVPATAGDVVISEIMYHPVERPAFTAAGDPVLDLADDIHEFIELHNRGSSTVSLAGWKLEGGIDFTFPPQATLPPSGYLVIARDPQRLAAVAAYQLASGSVLGPWKGSLSNDGEPIRLASPDGSTADAVSYQSSAPWPIAANSLGAEADWTGISELSHQYRGRSLERISMTWGSHDPANWLASPLTPGPSPGRPNAVSLPQPFPVVTQFRALSPTGSVLIRANEAVTVEATLSPHPNPPAQLQLEYFRDDINATSEARTVLSMAAVADQPGKWRATVPGQASRSIMRYRFLAVRTGAPEVISPRPDDPMAWHAWFVSPVRSSARPVYDLFISSASLSTLAANIAQSPRRITLPDPPGLPRASWTATQPAVLVRDGIVYDIRMRHHGSRYRRDPSRQSYKIQFPRYARMDGNEAIFFKDKGEEHRIAGLLYRAAGLPAFTSRYADIYFNGNGLLTRLEVPEMDDRHFARFAESEALRLVQPDAEATGEFYKATGVVPFETSAGIGTTSAYLSSGEGPYYIGNCAPIPPKQGWLTRQRYEFTYGPQMHQWIGGRDTEAMITGLWQARGDSPTAVQPNLAALRQWLSANFDVTATLDYIAIRNWCSPVDDATHNYFLWRRASGRWAMLPWDVDGELSNTTQSIFWDEFAVPQPDTLRGPQWIKDSFLKAFREEFRQRLWLLNHTVLLPANFGSNGYGGAQSFATARHANVNAQLGLGTFHRPATPGALAPAPGAPVAAGSVLRTSSYAHSAPAPTPRHHSTTWLIRMSGRAWSQPIVRLTSTTFLTELPIPFSELTFGTSCFWKCIHTDADGHPSFESQERSFVFGPGSGPPPDVQLSEIFARGSGADFIELHNAGSAPAELSGMGLTDNPATGAKFTFPPGTTLTPGARFVLTLDETAAFRLDGDGQSVLLLRPDGSPTDAVTFGPQAAGLSIARFAAAWQLAAPTPGQPNEARPTGPATSLRFNEWLASNPDGDDWLELHNASALPVVLTGLRIGNGTAVTTLPDLSFIAAGGFQKFVADRTTGANHLNFKLSSGGGTLALSDLIGTSFDTLSFGPQTTGLSQGRLPDGMGPIRDFPGSASPGEPNAFAITDVVISRIHPGVILHNRSHAPVALRGWQVSHDPVRGPDFTFPEETPDLLPGATCSLAAGALPFSLDPVRGGSVVLRHSGTHRQRQRYGPSDGFPWGRVTTWLGEEFVRVLPGPEAPLNIPVVGPVVVSEFCYHPPDLPGADRSREFVELLNTGAAGADLSGWALAGDVSLTIPEGTLLAAGGRLVLAATDPATFRRLYALPDTITVIGPWLGDLPNSGGTISLVQRLAPVTTEGPDFGTQPRLVTESFAYRDNVPWPPEADGNGFTVVRSRTDGYGNDPPHWTAGSASPGSPDSPNIPPSLAFTAPADSARHPAGQPVTLSVQAQDPDGSIAGVAFAVDGITIAVHESPPFATPWTSPVPGPQRITATAWDNRMAITTTEITVTLTNDPPLAAILAPLPGRRLATGTAVTIEAAASDPEGLVERVELLVDDTVVATLLNPPWRSAWTPGGTGPRRIAARVTDASGLTATSPAITVFAAGPTGAEPVVAWHVPAGTTGNQAYGGSLGMDFEVIAPIVITKLGVFDSGSNGLSSTIIAQIWRQLPSPQLLTSLTFSNAVPGTLAAGSGSRFKPLTTPLTLPPGAYTMVAYGYSAAEPNGNSNGNRAAWSTRDGGGLIRFTGGGRYGEAAQFPPNADGGPADRYAAGTMEFMAADKDADGMPDDWETTHGFDPANHLDAATDPDGDGFRSLEEFAAGTDPRSASSAPSCELRSLTQGVATVRFALPAQRRAIIQFSGELTFWRNLEEVPPASVPRTLERSLPLPSTPGYLRIQFAP